MSNVLKYGSKNSIVRIAEHFPCRLLNLFPHQRFSQARERNLPLEKKKKTENKKCNSELSNPHTFNLQDTLEFAT